MDAKQIGVILQSEIRSAFVGVYAVDELERIPAHNKSFGSVVINTDPAHLPGEHWVVVCMNHGYAEYFDPLGLPPSRQIRQFLKSHFKNKVERNLIRYQSITSSLCGAYCILYILSRFRNQELGMDNLLANLFKPLSFAENDINVQRFMSSRYNLHLPIIDGAFIMNRIFTN